MPESKALKDLAKHGFKVEALHHADAIMLHDMPGAADELCKVLLGLSIPIEDLVRGGGGEADSTQRLRKGFTDLKWTKHEFVVEKSVDGKPSQSQSHIVDHVKVFDGFTFALEIEWNNKDPFFDRDLDNFKRLHAEGALSVGAIVTRGSDMQDSLRELIEVFAKKRGIKSSEDLTEFYTPTPRQKRLYDARAASEGSFARGWAECFVADKFGEATTHWRKLATRMERGVGNPCPLVLIGIPASVIKL